MPSQLHQFLALPQPLIKNNLFDSSDKYAATFGWKIYVCSHFLFSRTLSLRPDPIRGYPASVFHLLNAEIPRVIVVHTGCPLILDTPQNFLSMKYSIHPNYSKYEILDTPYTKLLYISVRLSPK